MKELKERIYDGEIVHGCWINLGSLVAAEIIGHAGFDWVLVDLEHGAGETGILYQQLQILQSSSAAVCVRTDTLARNKVQRILDAGATGIMFPQLKKKEEVGYATRLMYYPPKGIRGMAKMVRATGFGAHADEYIKSLDKKLVGIIQIETTEALDNIDSIAATDGVDVLFVGPNDLSLALGVFGQLQHSQYQQAIRAVADASRKHGKTPGVLLQDPAEYTMYADLGYRFLACGADGTFVYNGAKAMVQGLNVKRNGTTIH
jgi:4-hydroxy-2-oxoheptanedioate aldolase